MNRSDRKTKVSILVYMNHDIFRNFHVSFSSDSGQVNERETKFLQIQIITKQLRNSDRLTMLVED